MISANLSAVGNSDDPSKSWCSRLLNDLSNLSAVGNSDDPSKSWCSRLLDDLSKS